MSPGSGLHVLVLAGGSGTRFWPLSRVRRPKPFLTLLGGRSMLRATFDRARRLAPASRVWVVTSKPLVAAVRREIPALRRDRVVVEPSPKDTAPAIALACATIAKHDPSAIVAVLPSDQVIDDVSAFEKAVEAAYRAARGGALVCLGVVPDRPATGFGYLEVEAKPKARVAMPVTRFVEKPGPARAARFVRSGRYLWNGGMFVWHAGRFLEELTRVAPRLRRVAEAVAGGSLAAWRSAPSISIDHAFMEKASGIVAVPLDAGWDDLGSWDAAARRALQSRRPRTGGVLWESEGSVVFGGERLVAIVGVPGIVVVDTADALLVVSRAASESMRDCVRRVEAMGRRDLL